MRRLTILLLLLFLLPSAAPAAIGLLLPADDMLGQGQPASLALRIRLFDPVARSFQALDKPQRFGFQHLGEQTDLLGSLKPQEPANPGLWRGDFAVKRAGDHTFSAKFAPHWDSAEEQFLVHYAKLCVNAFGLEEGWDEPVGLEAEIVPLTRPYGLWTGSLFSGQVLLDGEPAPYAAIEVIWLGDTPDAPAPLALAAAARSQKLRADASGVFHAAMPRAGWWGFAATLDADWTLKKGGEEMPVALVTSYWVQTRDLK